MSNAMLAHLATRIFDVPLFITESKLDVIFHVLGDRLGIDMPGQTVSSAELAALAMPRRETMLLRAAGGGDDCDIQVMNKAGITTASGNSAAKTIAVIPVFGSLVHRTTGLDAMSGLRSYEGIRRDFQAAMRDSAIDAVAFEFASNGGEGHGLFDLADEIHQAARSGGKPIAAIVNEYAFSAGYALASAAGTVYLTRSSMAGSVGVILRHVDRSGKTAADGLKYTTLYRGARKNDFSADGPLSKEAKGRLDEILDSAYEMFTDTVARQRGMKVAAVKATEAGIYQGNAAVEIGFADHVMSFNQAISHLAGQISKKPTGGLRMGDQKLGLQHQLEALMKGSSDDENKAAMAAIGYVPAGSMASQADKEKFGGEKYAAGVTAGREQAQEIVSLCLLAGQPLATANAMLDKKMSVETARQELTATRAKEDGQRRVTSTVTSTGSGQVSSLVANAQARADKKIKFEHCGD